MLTSELKKLSKHEISQIINKIKISSVRYKPDDLQALYQEAQAKGVDPADILALQELQLLAHSDGSPENNVDLPDSSSSPQNIFTGHIPVDSVNASDAIGATPTSNAPGSLGKINSSGSTATSHLETLPEQQRNEDFFRTLKLKDIQPEVLHEQAQQSHDDDDDDYDDGSFPILRFLADFYKTLAWVFFAVFPAAAGYVSLNFLRGNTPLIVVIFIAAAFIGILMLISFYAKAEKIMLGIATERHLRKITRSKKP